MKNSLYLLGLVCVILIVSCVSLWQDKQQLEGAVQNQYAQQLAIASEEMGSLNTALFQSTILSDERALNEQLLAIHESSGKVKNALSAIPVLSEQSNDWIKYMTEIESLAGTTIKDGDYADYQKRSADIASQFHSLEEEWNVLTASYFQHASSIDDYVKSTTDFSQLSTKIKSYSEQAFPVTASESDYEKKKSLQQVEDGPITKQQAIDRFHAMFPQLKEATLTVSFNEEDAPYSFYHIQFVHGSRIGYVDLLKNGGHLLSVLIDRPILEKTTTQEQAKESAEKFLKDNGFENIDFVEVRENHEAWHYVFARVEDGVVVYPDAIQIKIAKDNGEVIGVSALEYVQKETLPQVEKKDFKWEEMLSPVAKVQESKLAVIEDQHYALALCYEALVTSSEDKNHTYRLFVDAETLKLVKIELLN